MSDDKFDPFEIVGGTEHDSDKSLSDLFSILPEAAVKDPEVQARFIPAMLRQLRAQEVLEREERRKSRQKQTELRSAFGKRRDWRSRAEKAPPIPWVFQGWIPRGEVTTFFGEDGKGKTTVMMLICMMLAVGRPIFGVKTTPQRVFFLAGEDSESVLTKRVMVLAEKLGLTEEEWGKLANNFVCEDMTLEEIQFFQWVRDSKTHENSVKETPFYNALLDELDNRDYDLLVIDPMLDAYAENEVDTNKVREFMQRIRRLARQYSIGVVFIGHPAKSADSEYGGSRYFSAKARSRWFLEEVSDGMVRLSVKKLSYGKKPNPETFVLRDGGVETVEEEFVEAVKHEQQKSVREHIVQTLFSLATRDEVASASKNATTYFPKLADRRSFLGPYSFALVENVFHEMLADDLMKVPFDGSDGRPLIKNNKRMPKEGVWPVDPLKWGRSE